MNDNVNRKYDRRIRDKYHPNVTVTVDVYRVLEAFDIKSHPVAHAIKKLLAAGQRGKGDALQDLQEAVQSITCVIRDLEKLQELEEANDDYV